MQYACQICDVKSICHPAALSETEQLALGDIANQKWTLEKSEVLFKAEQPCDNLYIVRSGALKYVYEAQGKTKIMHFYLPGDVVGLDAINSGAYPATAIALTQTAICTINIEDFKKRMHNFPNLQDALLDIASAKCAHAGRTVMMQQEETVEDKTMAFFKYLSMHFTEQGCSATEFMLPMSRKDIASFLGMAPETLSRVLARLQADKKVDVQGKHVQLL
jgi:CRP/FNR family transcriptional regulator, anaerobic regulatory protein